MQLHRIGTSSRSSACFDRYTSGLAALLDEQVFEPAPLSTELKLGDWISDALIFSAGIAGGVLVSEITSIFRGNKRRRTEVVSMRARVLSDLKEHHDREILHAAFRTTEDIKSELNKSLQTLCKTVTTVLDPVNDQPQKETERVVHRPEPRE